MKYQDVSTDRLGIVVAGPVDGPGHWTAEELAGFYGRHLIERWFGSRAEDFPTDYLAGYWGRRAGHYGLIALKKRELAQLDDEERERVIATLPDAWKQFIR